MNVSAPNLEQRALRVLSALSYRTGELAPYLREVAQGLSQLLDLDWSVVTLSQEGQYGILASSIEQDPAANQIYSLHGSLAGTVVATGMPLVVEDGTTCADYGSCPEGYRAYLGVPLRTPVGAVIGTVCSFQHQPRHFSEEEVRLAEIFAERAATAIDNYQLYQQQQQFNEALEAEVVKRTVELRATQAKLMDLNSQLEQRVEERTLELKQLNAQLQAEIAERQQSEERLRQLAENLEQVFWMLSLEGEPIYVSPAFETLWGYPRERWYSDPNIWLEAIHPDDRERVRQAFFQDQAGKYEEEYRIVRPDGTVRIIRDQAFPIRDEQGHIYRIAGIAEDVTEQRQSQQEQFKAIASLAEVGELASMIVHEIRNPLTTVLMGLNFCQRLELPEPTQEYLSLSLSEAGRLRQLLNEILLYAKPQSLQQEALELNRFLAEVLKAIRIMPAAISRRIEWIPADQPVWVLGDRDKLKQVLINLVDNACQAVQEGEGVTCQLEVSGAEGVIRVCNRGEPIPADLLPKLTRPFYTTKSEGTGLGLPIVKRIVEAHGGKLTLASSREEGTIVRIQLPLGQPGREDVD